MKRVFRTLCLVAMVALVATSCKKNEEGAEFTVNFAETYGFQAGPNIFGSKAYFDVNDSYKFKWNEGDQMMVYNLASDYTQSNFSIYTADPGCEGQTTARFTTVDPIGQKKDLGYFVFYNPEKANGVLAEGNQETFTVSAVQNYVSSYCMDPTALVMASTAEAEGDHLSSFTLQHIFGYLNISVGSLNGAQQIDRIVVADDEHNLTGDLDIKLPQVNPSEFNHLLELLEAGIQSGDMTAYQSAVVSYLYRTLGYHAHGAQGKEITLNCNNEEIGAYWKHFIISLRPGALYEGFNVKIYLNGVAEPVEFDFDGGLNWLIKPGWFRNMYVTTDGNIWG